MPSTLRHTDLELLGASARDYQHDVGVQNVEVVKIITRRYETRVLMHQLTDGSVVLDCRTTDGSEFTLTCPPTMPFTTLSHILENL